MVRSVGIIETGEILAFQTMSVTGYAPWGRTLGVIRRAVAAKDQPAPRHQVRGGFDHRKFRRGARHAIRIIGRGKDKHAAAAIGSRRLKRRNRSILRARAGANAGIFWRVIGEAVPDGFRCLVACQTSGARPTPRMIRRGRRPRGREGAGAEFIRREDVGRAV